MSRIGPLIEELKALNEKTFRDKYGKNKWATVKDLDPKTAKDLLGLINTAYAKIGGHLKIKSASDLSKEASVIKAIDLDDDPEADALKLGKKKTGGLKSVGWGHDGKPKSKKAAIAQTAIDLKTSGNFSEMSDAIAHIMLTRFNVPSVDNEAKVRRILGKDIEWVGARPDGKYPKNKGWYYRKIGGKLKLKIMLGKPS